MKKMIGLRQFLIWDRKIYIYDETTNSLYKYDEHNKLESVIDSNLFISNEIGSKLLVELSGHSIYLIPQKYNGRIIEYDLKEEKTLIIKVKGTYSDVGFAKSFNEKIYLFQKNFNGTIYEFSCIKREISIIKRESSDKNSEFDNAFVVDNEKIIIGIKQSKSIMEINRENEISKISVDIEGEIEEFCRSEKGCWIKTNKKLLQLNNEYKVIRTVDYELDLPICRMICLGQKIIMIPQIGTNIIVLNIVTMEEEQIEMKKNEAYESKKGWFFWEYSMQTDAILIGGVGCESAVIKKNGPVDKFVIEYVSVNDYYQKKMQLFRESLNKSSFLYEKDTDDIILFLESI